MTVLSGQGKTYELLLRNTKLKVKEISREIVSQYNAGYLKLKQPIITREKNMRWFDVYYAAGHTQKKLIILLLNEINLNIV